MRNRGEGGGNKRMQRERGIDRRHFLCECIYRKTFFVYTDINLFVFFVCLFCFVFVVVTPFCVYILLLLLL